MSVHKKVLIFLRGKDAYYLTNNVNKLDMGVVPTL